MTHSFKMCLWILSDFNLYKRPKKNRKVIYNWATDSKAENYYWDAEDEINNMLPASVGIGSGPRLWLCLMTESIGETCFKGHKKTKAGETK